ncbi:unnamed protein product [Candida verbasci]|uniref:Uncharacterized protein n=1 Tax=Candida verbasci TaxID=1227364 RepID=A0A9W4TW17_9ASCO|nr:unnamed protein product [Candida verbasci]
MYYLIGIIVLFAVYKLVNYFQVRQFKKSHHCEDPYKVHNKWFGIPAIFEVMESRERGEFISEPKDMYLETFQVNMAGSEFITTKDPTNIKALLSTQFEDFSIGKRHAFLNPLLGDSIFTLDGPRWRHSRNFLRPQFSRESVSHTESLEHHVQTLLQLIKAENGKTFDFQRMIARFTLDTATAFLFNHSVNSMYDEDLKIGDPPNEEDDVVCTGQEFFKAFETAGDILSKRSMAQSFYFLVDGKEFRNAIKTIQNVAEFYVDKALNLTEQQLNENKRYTILTELVKITRDRKVLKDEILSMLLAGRNTTSSSISFLIYELAQNPQIYQKLRNKILEAFGPEGKPTFESLKRCEYLKNVVSEILRLYPTVPLNLKCATKKTTLPRGGGDDESSPIFIDKGTSVVYRTFDLHRQEKYFGSEPDKFIPERWDNLKKVGWAYIPFNGGPRICLGQQFALTEISYVITRLCQTFEHISTKQEYPPKMRITLILNLKDGAQVSFT